MSKDKKKDKKKKPAEEEIDGCEGTSTLKGKIDKKKKLKAKKQTVIYGDDCSDEDHVCVCGKEIERDYVYFDNSTGPSETWTKSQIDGFMRANTDVIKGEYKKTTNDEYKKIIKESKLSDGDELNEDNPFLREYKAKVI